MYWSIAQKPCLNAGLVVRYGSHYQPTSSWEFIKKYLLDLKNGEWFSGVTADHKVLGSDKISMWKAPYHNSRSCLEMLERLEHLR